MKKYSHEYVYQFYKEKGYELMSEYVNTYSIDFIRDKDGYVYSTNFYNFKQNKQPNKFYKNNPYTIQNIELWLKNNALDYELISDEYINCHERLLFRCPNDHIFESSLSNMQRGRRCPYCSNPPRKIELGINTIWDTDRWMCDLGVSEEDAKTHSRASNKSITVTCPNCGKIKNIKINRIYFEKSIGCSCGDGVSYSEKIMISLLNQLDIKYIKEYKPLWSNNKRYDFYLVDYNYIIECHGKQHYGDSFFARKNIKTLEDEQSNDIYKKELALSNGINEYVVLDCRKSDLKWIKNSILNSELNNMFDLSKVDWLKCEEFALSNQVKKVCDYWCNKEEWETTVDVGKKFNLNRGTIRKYLINGTNLGWCNYDAKEEANKRNSKGGKCNTKPIMILKDNICLNVFSSATELEKQSEKLFNVKLRISCISSVCNNKTKQYKGYSFKYITKEEYDQYRNIII